MSCLCGHYESGWRVGSLISLPVKSSGLICGFVAIRRFALNETVLDEIINDRLVLIVSELFSAISSRGIIKTVKEDQPSSQKVSRTCES